jgi:hypothetical protein
VCTVNSKTIKYIPIRHSQTYVAKSLLIFLHAGKARSFYVCTGSASAVSQGLVPRTDRHSGNISAAQVSVQARAFA